MPAFSAEHAFHSIETGTALSGVNRAAAPNIGHIEEAGV
jgi:hypothetical protein